MKLGVALPTIDVGVGGDPEAIREFAQAAEGMGYKGSLGITSPKYIGDDPVSGETGSLVR